MTNSQLSDQRSYTIRCEWGASGLSALSSGSQTIVIVDIFSFTTGVEIATSRGARVFPYQWDQTSATAYAKRLGAICAGPRGSKGYTISPSSLLNIPANTPLVLPSPNGSALTYKASSNPDATIIAASFRNAGAVIRRISDIKGPVSVIPAGEQWADGTLRPSLEDWLGAGAIIAGLKGTRSPEAQAAASLYYNSWDKLGDILRDSVSGQELVESGFEKDVRLASELNSSRCVPTLRDGAYRNETVWETV